MAKHSSTNGFTDLGPPTPERLRKMERGEPSDADFHTEVSLDGLALTLTFRISWCHLSSCYTAEYVSSDANALVVDVMTWGHLCAFFLENWSIKKLRGVQCDEHESELPTALFSPQVIQTKNRH